MLTVLSSNSVNDVFQTLANQYWDHSVTPRQVTRFSQVLVVPNKALRADIESGPCGVMFRLNAINPQQHEDWHSNLAEGSTTEYLCRLHAIPDTMRILTKAEVEDILGDGRGSVTGVRYIENVLVL